MKTQTNKILPFTLALTVLALYLSVLQSARAQNWVNDIPLKTARWNHTATLLTNGLVLIAGGEIFNDSTNGYFQGTNSAELYSPITGASRLTAPMNDAHWGGSATRLTNGLVLVAGGRNNGGSVLATAELYDPSSGTWSNTGSLNQQRSAFTATLLPNGKVLVVGGQNNSAVDQSSAELYDPASGTWATTASLNYATDSGAAVLLPDGKVLFCGGSDGLGGTLTNAVLYNPTNQTWINTGPMHTARGGHVLTLLPNGQVLVVGGVFNESAELYTPATGLWTNAASMNDTRSSPTAALLPNGQVLVLGGEPWLTSAELYNPTNNTWTLASSLHVARFFNTTTPLGDGQVVVTGGNAGTIGYYNGPAIASVETYAGHPIQANHTLVAHYPFDAPDGYGPFSGQLLMDTSGNGYNIDGPSTSDGTYPILTTDCIAGESAIQYDGNNWHLLPTNLLTTIAGTYSLSLWLKTTQVSGNDSDAGPDAPGIVWAGGAADNYYDSEPMTLTGSKLGFYTGDDQATLHSVTSINSGAFTHIVVTRDQPSGVKRIYINGVLDSTSTGDTNFLSASTDLLLGESYYSGGVAGIIDDVQFYSGLLSAADVAYLHANPGSEVPVGPPAPSLDVALNTTNLVWITGGDANWFVEATNSHDSVSAAQSGTITNYQQTWIQTTVTGPGTLSFWWQVSSEGADFLEFDLDEIQQDEISGIGQDWAQLTYSIPSGTHTLRWLYFKDGSGSDGVDAGFLDEVSYVPTTGIIVTASPLTGLVPLTVQFTSPGVDSGGNTVTNWSWNFGDGATSTAQSPSHIYTNVGSFWPSLTAYSTFGALPLSVAGLNAIIVTNFTLNVSASPPSGALPLTVQFTSPGVDSAGNTVTNWNWNFGDGTTNTTRNPAHVYTRAGSFSPSLVARSTHGAWPLDVTGLGTITVTNIPNRAFRTLYTFAPITTFGFNSGLVLSGNTLYGTTSSGGASNWGMLFAINTSGSGFTNLHNYNNDATNGARPNGVVLSGNTLYGPTDFGGTRGGGTVYAISTNGTGYTNLYNVNFNVDPYSPSGQESPLVLAGSNLYGGTWFGGYYNKGALFSVATNGASSGIVHNFTPPTYSPYAVNYDGIIPGAGMIYSGGTVYGTAEQGGYTSGGTVFAFETSNPGSFRILYYFTSSIAVTNSDGANPWGRLLLSGSTLYGTTLGGGSTGNGVLFAVNTNGSGFTNLHSFTGGNGGTTPHAGLVLSGNTLYGTTSAGGTSDYGTLFAINTDGSGFTTLYSFTGGADGANPQADLVLSGNTLYGTANAGGSSGGGTLFSFALWPQLTITPAGTNVILTWPTIGAGYTLQSTTNLGAAAAWNSVLPAPVVVNGQNTVTNPISSLQKFYRLSQ